MVQKAAKQLLLTFVLFHQRETRDEIRERDKHADTHTESVFKEKERETACYFCACVRVKRERERD